MLAKVEVALTFVGLYVRSCYRFGGNLHNIYMPLWIGFSWGKAQAENIATTHYLHKYSWESFPIALPGILTCLHTAGEQLIHKTSACVNRDKVKTWALCFLGGLWFEWVDSMGHIRKMCVSVIIELWLCRSQFDMHCIYF